MKSIYLLLFLTITFSCKDNVEYVDLVNKEKKENVKVDWKSTRVFYLNAITRSINRLEKLKTIGANHKNSKVYFANVRVSYKEAETYAAYLNPSVSDKVNGPSIPKYNEDNSTIVPPMGLQRMEEYIYSSSEGSKEQFLKEIDLTIGLMEVLKKNIQERELTSERFFISTHQQLLRIITHSITGFDTPISHLGLEEAIVSLHSLEAVYNKSLKDLILSSDAELHENFKNNIEKAIEFIGNNNDFENFDRFTFIRDYINPLTTSWVNIRKKSGLWAGTNNLPFNFDSPTFFEEDFFNVNFFMPSTNRNFTKKHIALGEKLFFDKNLSKKGDMACASCHVPDLAYSSGLKFDVDNEGENLTRNTPTLINTVFQKSYFWDGRSETLMDQISSVFINNKEFEIGMHSFSIEILKDSTYEKLFIEAYGEVSQRNILVAKAITSYVGNLNAFNSKFDRNIRSEENTFTTREKQGFNLFMGKALCATCHFVPIMNGTIPPFYKETEKEIIGVPDTKENLKLDEDFGIYLQYSAEIQRGMFKTPILRNLELTAPYMHNGVYNTLKEVIEFYDSGGGVGLGFDLPNQTLPSEKLNLSNEEKQFLIAYLKTLNDSKIKIRE